MQVEDVKNLMHYDTEKEDFTDEPPTDAEKWDLLLDFLQQKEVELDYLGKKFDDLRKDFLSKRQAEGPIIQIIVANTL